MRSRFPPVSVRARAGMTLVEVLVGVFIVGVVIVLGIAAFFSISSALDGQGARQVKVYHLTDAVDLLREDLLGTYVTDPDAGCGFRLEPSSTPSAGWIFTFCSLTRVDDTSDPQWAGMRSIRYVAEPSESSGMTLLRVDGRLGTFAQEPVVYTSVVVQSAANLALLVWHDDEWTDRWPPDDADPQEVMAPPAVRLILEPMGSDAQEIEADLPIPTGWTISPDE